MVPKSIVVLAEDDVLFSFKGLLLLLLVLVICRTRNMAPLGLKQEPWFLLWSSGKMAVFFPTPSFPFGWVLDLSLGPPPFLSLFFLSLEEELSLYTNKNGDVFPFS